MSNIIIERVDMLEAFLWLKGQKIVLGRGQNKVEWEISKVIEVQIPLENGLLTVPGIKLINSEGSSIELEFPYILEETTDGFRLDYNKPHTKKPEDEKKRIEAEDSHFYEFLRRGKGHHYNLADRSSKRDIFILVL